MELVSGVSPDLKYLEGGSKLYTVLDEDGQTLDMAHVLKQAKRGHLNIAIIGGIRSGKSTLASILEEDFGMERLSFGEKLKEVVHEAVKHTPLAGKKNVPLLQAIGQQFREFHEDVWVSHVNQKFVEGNCTGFVIDDLRQPNEYLWALNNGFLIVRLHADEDIRYERALEAGDVIKWEDLRAETESYYKYYPVHFEVPNEGSLDHFKLCMWELFEPILVAYQDFHDFNTVVNVMDDMVRSAVIVREGSYFGSEWATDLRASYTIAKDSLLETDDGELKRLIIESYYEYGMTYVEMSIPLGLSTWKIRDLRNKALAYMWVELFPYIVDSVESEEALDMLDDMGLGGRSNG